MENQHRKITGYRELSQEEIDLMNEIKAAGKTLEELCVKVTFHVEEQWRQGDQGLMEMSSEELRLLAADPHAWLAAAKHELQTALMKLTRAVAQPTSF